MAGCIAFGMSASVASGTSQASWRISAPGNVHASVSKFFMRGSRAAADSVSSNPKIGMSVTSPIARRARRLGVGEGGHDLLGEEAQAREDVGLGNRLVGVQQKVDAVHPHGFPSLQRAQHALGAPERES